METKRKETQESDTATSQPVAVSDAPKLDWPDPPTFEAMCRFVQALLAGPEHDAAMEEHRRFEERWAAMTEEERAAARADDLVGAIDDPTFPRSTHFHEDFYGDGGKR